MKKVWLFLVFLVVCVMVSMQPVLEASPAPSHPLPVWSILGYLALVLLFAAVAAWMARGRLAVRKTSKNKIRIQSLNHEPGA